MGRERADAFDFWGPQTLVGPELKPGDKAPAFMLTKLKNDATLAVLKELSA